MAARDIFRSFFVFGLVFLLAQSAWSYNNRSRCNRAELKTKNCALKVGNRRFHFRPEKVLIHNGVFRKLLKQKYTGENIQWEKVWVERNGGNLFVQMLVWGPPETEAQIQKLHWLLIRARGTKPKWAFDHVVQKRSRKPGGDPKRPFLYEKRKKISIGPKDNQWMWFVGRKSGPLP